MNAYELADELDRIVKVSMPLHYITESAKMLRQQADRIAELEHMNKNWQLSETMAYNRIAELEKDLEGCEYFLDKRQSAEPFIWLKQDFDGEWIEVHPNKGIPLYTTPQIKELSDEEILSFTGFKNNPYDIFIEYEKEDLIKFARAILKKASEK